jgi:hypothetical protein
MGREIFGPEYLPYRQEKQMQCQFRNRERFFLPHSPFFVVPEVLSLRETYPSRSVSLLLYEKS